MTTLQDQLRAVWPHDEGRDVREAAAQRITAPEAEVAALCFQLLAASNYIDALGGVSTSYRAAIDAARSKT